MTVECREQGHGEEQEDGQYETSIKVKSNHLDCPLVAGCCVDHKSLALGVGRSNMSKTKSSRT